MPKKIKIDGLIEAVRYKNGQLAIARVYERRGTTYSDIIHLDRKSLIERLEQGRRFYTGQRQNLLASTFKVEKPVKLIERNGRRVISTREAPEQDEIEAPVF